MEMEQKKKVAKLHDNQLENEAEVKVGDERDDNELSDMDKLPPEMLWMILDYLDEKQLVKCRLLSSRWNEISCLLLQNKANKNPDSKLVVQLKGNMECEIVNKKPLDDFLKCFSPSEESPGLHRAFSFSCFSFENLNNMNLTQICEFISTFGPHMKTVCIDIKSEDITNFEKLWRLLLDFAPNIQHLRISGDSCLKNTILFDPINKFIAESDPNFKVVNPNDTFLKNLIKLEISSQHFGQFNNFMKNLLESTQYLREVSCSDPMNKSNDFKHLKVWQKLNKAYLVKNLEIKPISQSNLPPAELMKNVQLENLIADCYFENEKSNINYIHQALKSSQNTLSKLDLSNLTVDSMNFCFKEIKSLPNVRQLKIRIKNSTESGNILQRFSTLCPNITSLNLGFFRGDFSKVAPILWTGFKGVKSLNLMLNMTDKKNNFLLVDSAISGYSQESIERFEIKSELYNGMSLEEARRGEEQNPCILDLKGLICLKLGFFMGKRSLQMGDVENELRNSVFMKILPHHIRESLRPIYYWYVD